MRERVWSAAVLTILLAVPGIAQAQVEIRALAAGFTTAILTGDGVGIKASTGEPVNGVGENDLYRAGSGFWFADTEAKVPNAIEDDAAVPYELPRSYELHQNYPNPFNPVTTLLISLPERQSARLEIFNSIGQLVAVPLDAELAPGTHRVEWDARDVNGRNVASGVYIYRLVSGSYVETRTMTLLK